MNFRNPKYLLILDFEANCSNNNTRDHEICEFPVVLLDIETKTIVDEFRTFVKPVKIPKISNFIHKLTGITDKDIATGVTWTEAINLFNDFIIKHDCTSQNSTIVTCGNWDLFTMFPRQCTITNTKSMIPNRVKNLFSQWTNVKVVYSDFKKYTKLYGMARMLDDIGLKLIGRHHSGIDDCRNITEICIYLLNNGCVNELFEAIEKSK